MEAALRQDDRTPPPQTAMKSTFQLNGGVACLRGCCVPAWAGKIGRIGLIRPIRPMRCAQHAHWPVNLMNSCYFRPFYTTL